MKETGSLKPSDSLRVGFVWSVGADKDQTAKNDSE